MLMVELDSTPSNTTSVSTSRYPRRGQCSYENHSVRRDIAIFLSLVIEGTQRNGGSVSRHFVAGGGLREGVANSTVPLAPYYIGYS